MKFAILFHTVLLLASISLCYPDEGVSAFHKATFDDKLVQSFSGIGAGLLVGYGMYAINEGTCKDRDDGIDIHTHCAMNRYLTFPIAYSIGNFGGTLVASRLRKIHGNAGIQMLGQLLGTAAGFAAGAAIIASSDKITPFPFVVLGLCVNLGGVVGYDF